MVLCESDARIDPERILDEADLPLLPIASPSIPGSRNPLDPVGGQGQPDSPAPGPQEASSPEREENGASSKPERRIRVLLVDDHKAVRQAFAFVLRTELDIEVVGEAGSGPAALDLIRRSIPDVVLMDVNMPGMDGIEATRRIRAEFPRVHVIGLSMYESRERGAAMRNAGARAYVSKSDSYDTLIAAIRACREVKDQ